MKSRDESTSFFMLKENDGDKTRTCVQFYVVQNTSVQKKLIIHQVSRLEAMIMKMPATLTCQCLRVQTESKENPVTKKTSKDNKQSQRLNLSCSSKHLPHPKPHLMG